MQTWDAITSNAPNLHELPAQLHDSVQELFVRISNNGTLPLPGVPASWTGGATEPPPAPPPAELGPSSLSLSSAWSAIVNKATRHPFLTAAVTASAVTGTAYYFAPLATTRALAPVAKPLTRWVPVELLPKSNRPTRIISERGELRREAVLVLGADGVAADLALDLENRGFVVIATVAHPNDIEQLERRSRGWLKCLVLDPTDVGPAFSFRLGLGDLTAVCTRRHRASRPSCAPCQPPYRSASHSTPRATPMLHRPTRSASQPSSTASP